MIPVIGAILAGLFAGLLVVRARYGELRMSELPVLLLALLAGDEEEERLRLILRNRGMAVVPAAMPPAGPPPRPRRAIRAQMFEDDRRAMRELAASTKPRPVRYAACPQGHPNQLWDEGRRQMCACRKCAENRSNLRRERPS